MKKPFCSLAALCSALLLVFALGCSADKAPTAAPAPDLSLIGDLTGTVTGVVGGVTEVVGGVVNALLRPLVCPTNDSYSASRTIGREGGTLRVGPHTLTIPAGALSGDTRISGTAPEGSYAEIRFQPHGLTFERDVTLSVSYAQCGLLNRTNPPVIVYADDNRNILEVLKSTIDRRRETITGKTDHFSSYILAER